MSEIVTRDIQLEDEYFVSTCSHVGESEEIDACGRRRLRLIRHLMGEGAVVKAALLDGKHVGFAHGIPIEHSSWGPDGEGLMTIPCLFVLPAAGRNGIGRTLMEAVENDARRLGHVGMALTGFRDLPGAEWFMPAAFFEHIGYEGIDGRERSHLLWKPFSDDAVPPRFLKRCYAFTPIVGKVVVDLFYNEFCQTSGLEAQRVREVCAEFGDRVVLNESCAEDHHALLACGISRAIYVNGAEIGWGYEAPKDGIRAAIRRELDGVEGKRLHGVSGENQGRSATRRETQS